MSLAETVPAALPARQSSLPFKLAIALVLAALADWTNCECRAAGRKTWTPQKPI
jgi:hypothetical protein